MAEDKNKTQRCKWWKDDGSLLWQAWELELALRSARGHGSGGTARESVHLPHFPPASLSFYCKPYCCLSFPALICPLLLQIPFLPTCRWRQERGGRVMKAKEGHSRPYSHHHSHEPLSPSQPSHLSTTAVPPSPSLWSPVPGRSVSVCPPYYMPHSRVPTLVLYSEHKQFLPQAVDLLCLAVGTLASTPVASGLQPTHASWMVWKETSALTLRPAVKNRNIPGIHLGISNALPHRTAVMLGDRYHTTKEPPWVSENRGRGIIFTNTQPPSSQGKGETLQLLETFSLTLLKSNDV